MSTFDDIVSRITTLAAKTGTVNEKAAHDAVAGVIDDINAELSNHTIAARDTISVTTSTYKSIAMPARCRKIIELGYYDSGLSRMQVRYEEISEQEFNANYSGIVTLRSSNPSAEVNLWFLLDNSADGTRNVRLVYPPSASFTMLVRYFEPLAVDNIDRLEQRDVLFNGAVLRLPGWFADVGISRELYLRGMDTMRSNRRSQKLTIRPKMNPVVMDHNAVGNYLVR